MAILQGQTNLYGKVGPVVYRRYRKQVVVQSYPQPFKQTAASVEAAAEFGLCSSAARQIRVAFKPLHLHHDGGLVNRMNSAVSRAVRANESKTRGNRDLHDGDLSCLEGVDFNEESRLSDIWLRKPLLSRGEAGEVLVDIPETDISSDMKQLPRMEYMQVRLRVVVVAFDFKKQFFEYLGDETLVAENGTIAARRLEFTDPVPAGSIVLVGVAVQACQYTNYGGYVSMNNQSFAPAAIIGGLHYAGETSQDYLQEKSTYYNDKGQSGRIQSMTYEGNKLLKEMQARHLGLSASEKGS